MNEKWVVINPYGRDKDDYMVYGIFDSEDEALYFIRDLYNADARAERVRLPEPQVWA